MRPPQRAARFACLLAAFVFHGTVLAQQGSTDYSPPHNPENEYLEAIERIEGEYGPYAAELSDLYLGLGQTWFDRMEYERARDAFNRGVMVVRVNSGPNSPQQTDHLYLIANIEALLGNNDTADAVLDNIYFVNAEHYGEASPEMLPVIERMYDWYAITRPPGSVRSEYEDHKRAIELKEKILEINETHYGPGNPETAVAWRRLGEAQFQAVRWMLAQGMELTLDSRMEFLNRTMDTVDGAKVSIGDHYYAGRTAFRNYLDAIEADSSKTPLDYAEAYAELGDWYLAVGKFRNARELYERAYGVLARSDRYSELAEAHMAQPRPVHFFQPPPDFLQDAEAGVPEMHLDISMTVTRQGDVRYAEILNAPEALPEDVRGDILRLVRHTPFRPAMKAGEVVTTEGFIWQFAILL